MNETCDGVHILSDSVQFQCNSVHILLIRVGFGSARQRCLDEVASLRFHADIFTYCLFSMATIIPNKG